MNSTDEMTIPTMDLMDLIDFWFDLQRMSCETSVWGTPEFMANPPRAIRYLKITALAAALGIEGDIKTLFSDSDDVFDNKARVRTILADYRSLLQSLQGFWGRFLEAPREVAESYTRLAPVRKSIGTIGLKINKELARHIPCKRKQVSMDVLVKEYGFPMEDLLDVDVEWM